MISFKRISHTTALALTFVLIAALSCGSPRRGILTDSSGQPVAEASVSLVVVDDSGNVIETIENQTTDAKGKFKFDTATNTNASFVIEANLPSGLLRAFHAGGNHSIPINPLTNVWVSMVIAITETEGGRTLSDFSSQELRNITNTLMDADTSALDLNDQTAIRAFLISTIGRLVAEASGASISAQSRDTVNEDITLGESTVSMDPFVCSIRSTHLFTTDPFRFDIQADGALCGDAHATLTSMLLDPSQQMLVTSEDFAFPVAPEFPSFPTRPMRTLNDREVIIGPPLDEMLIGPTLNTSGVEVARRVYIPENKTYVRYIESFTNPTENDVDIAFKIQNFMDTGSQTSLLVADGADDAVPSTDSRYLAAYDQFDDRPTVGFVLQDGMAAVQMDQLHSPGIAGGQVNEITHFWNLTVPANSTRMIMHFMVYTTSRSESEVQATLETLAETPDMSLLTVAETAQVANFLPSRGTLIGEAGSVIGSTNVTATSTNPCPTGPVFLTHGQSASDTTITRSAQSDGSFHLPISVCTGDTVRITSEDGLDTTITVP